MDTSFDLPERFYFDGKPIVSSEAKRNKVLSAAKGVYFNEEVEHIRIGEEFGQEIEAEFGKYAICAVDI